MARRETFPPAPVPAVRTLPSLRLAAAGCRACPLWRSGTQTVFGEGSASARIVMVGEQPGHEEDLAGRPFVGPAGRELDRALAAVGIDRSVVYVTNAVKHFKWTPAGGRRLHKKPSAREVEACFPWLLAELERIRPAVLVCLGSTAARAVLGPEFRVTRRRGELVPSPYAPHTVATVHPSAILHAPDDRSRRAERARFTQDLFRVAEVLRATEAAPPPAP